MSKDTPKDYYVIFAALLILTGITTGAAFMDFGYFNFPIAMIIATIKAVLVVWFFMHLRHMSKLSRIFAAGGVFWLAIMLAFTFADYLTRETLIPPKPVTWIDQSAVRQAYRESPRFEHHTSEAAPAEHH